MMIAIPNMEKPKECKECQWHLDFYIEDKQVGGLCTITEKDDKENACPLIEIDLVRCEECKWWTKQADSIQGRCELLKMYPSSAWYCGNGKRRTDE